MVKIGEKTVVSITCQDVILQLAEQYCSEGEYLHFGMKQNPKKYVLVTDENQQWEQFRADTCFEENVQNTL